MRHHPARRRSVAALAGAATLALAGCTAGGSQGGEPSGDDGEAPSGGTLTVSTSFVINSIDPGQVYEATGALAVHAMYDTLVTFEGSDVTTPVPLLAESWEANDDATEFTFTLRDDVTFSDGSELTAQDVAFSINRLHNLAGSPSVTVEGLSAAAPSDDVVVVTSETPNPNVPTILAMPAAGVLNSEEATANGATDAEDAATTDSATAFLDGASLGSGPYVLDSFDPASEIVLTANPEYWGDAPEFDRVVIQNTEAQNQKLAIERADGAMIALDLSGRLLDGLAEGLQTSASQDTFYFVTLHQDPAVSEVTSNPEFVQALRASIDYAGLAALFGEDARPAAGMVPTAFPGALSEDEVQVQDLDAAADHLAASGLTDPTVSLMFPAMTYRGVDLATIATKIQNDAAQAGITIELDPQPIAAFLDAQSAGNVAFRFSPQSLNYPVASSLVNNFAPGQPSAMRSGWSADLASPEMIAAGDAVTASIDPDEQVTAMQEWQRLLNAESPFITLAYNSGTVVATADLSGADYSPAGWQVDLRAVGRG
ncbi:ABC transporter substrate-binding protein [Beutenbergia cavernae]|uniref:ABC transporter substrate-binding protein n=1 Tax=Beutenbergia cavernae TaxID=84757 RepID=UPI00019AD576|nr:ABC transporter substrate-binding protein [Beutenbergia cavernae]